MSIPSNALSKVAALIEAAIAFREEMLSIQQRTGQTDQEVFTEIARVLDENDKLALEYSLELQAMIASKTTNP